MKENRYFPTWKRWLKIGRLVPLITSLAGAIAILLSLFGLLSASLLEQIIVALLTLLSIDALVERLSLLERIDERLERLPDQELLRDRSQLIRMEELGANATEIWAAGIALVSIVHPYYDFYLKKLRDGCNLRFLVLDPNSDAVGVRDKQLSAFTIREDITTSLVVLDNLMKQRLLKGKCEVRLSRTYLPFSLVIVDGKKEHALMTVEMLTYKTNLHERPHFQLTKRNNQSWFELFYGQFQSLWNDSLVYKTRSKTLPFDKRNPDHDAPIDGHITSKPTTS